MVTRWDWLTLTPERIKALRVALNLTQPAFAAYLGREVQGLPPNVMTVSRWERGVRRPTRHWGPVLARLEREVGREHQPAGATGRQD